MSNEAGIDSADSPVADRSRMTNDDDDDKNDTGSLPLNIYHRASQVGQGTYGSVLVVYNGDGQEFALKLFLPDDDDDDDDFDEDEDWKEEEEEEQEEEEEEDYSECSKDDGNGNSEGENEEVDEDDEEEDEETFSDEDDADFTMASSHPLDLGALREISILRLLRGTPAREHCIIHLHDVQSNFQSGDDHEEDTGAGTANCLCMAMPLYPSGSLGGALESPGFFLNNNKATKVQLAHDVLTAVHFLHSHCGVAHRDIKSDNILLQAASTISDGNSKQILWRAVLTDFSLALPVNKVIYGESRSNEEHNHTAHVKATAQPMTPCRKQNKNQTPGKRHKTPSKQQQQRTHNNRRRHTAAIGTLVYNAPEVRNHDNEYYDPFQADMWSVGVVLLELLSSHQQVTLLQQVQKVKHVGPAIQNALAQLPTEEDDNNCNTNDKENRSIWPQQRRPFPNLVRSLLREEPSKRLSAEVALREHPLFVKFQLNSRMSGHNDSKKVPTLTVTSRLPYDVDDGYNDQNHSDPRNVACRKLYRRRWQRIEQACQYLQSEQDLTRQAALDYSIQMEQIDDTIDHDDESSQVLLDCVVLAHKFFEVDLIRLDNLEEENDGIFAHWTVGQYVDTESSLFLLLDYCLYPRKLRQF